MAIRATYTQETNQGITDRIEIHDSDFVGDPIVLTASKGGFRFSHREIGVENDGLVNPYKNQIMEGVLDFFPRINPNDTEENTLLEDILGADVFRFRIVWKQDSVVEWQGYVDTRKRSFPERSTTFTATIRARDFEVLKGVDYKVAGSLPSGREKIIEIFAEQLSFLNFGVNIKTATSWIINGQTGDYLNYAYKDKFAFRTYARTGDESDEAISVYEALLKNSEGLIISQKGGVFWIEQITEYEDAATSGNLTNIFTYNSSGVLQTSETANRGQAAFKSKADGTPWVKITSNNDGYPAIKRVRVKYDHRTSVSGIKLPESTVFLDDGTSHDTTASYDQLFVSDGNQKIVLNFRAQAYSTLNLDRAVIEVTIQAGSYYYNGSSWTTNSANRVEVTLQGGGIQVGGQYVYTGVCSEVTTDVPAAADGTLTITIPNALIDDPPVNVDLTELFQFGFKIENPVAQENSTFIDYQLTQSDDYPQYLTLEDTWFGDGPTAYSRGAISTDINGSNLTTDDWARRGEVSFVSYHEILSREVMDAQRSWVRKLDAQIEGDYDNTRVLIYDGNRYFYAGGTYVGERGTWNPHLYKINIVTAADTFETLPKFTSDEATGTSANSGGGGIDYGSGDSRWLRIANNLSDLNNAETARDNLGLAIGTDVQAHSAQLDTLSGLSASNASDIVSISNDNWQMVLNLDSIIDENNPLLASSSPTFAAVTVEDIKDASGNVLEFDGSGNVSIPGNLEVLGETFYAQVTNIEVEDPLMLLAKDNATTALDIGFIGQRSGLNVGSIWDESNDEFAFIFTNDDATTAGNVSIASYADFHAGELISEGLKVANGLVYADSEGTLANSSNATLDGDGNQIVASVTINNRLRLNNNGTINWGSDLTGVRRGILTWDTGLAIVSSYGDLRLSAGGFSRNHIFIQDSTDFIGIDTNTPSHKLDVNGSFGVSTTSTFSGVATFESDIEFQTKIESDNYLSGILGTGAQLNNDASGGSFFEVDNMRVRNELRAHIFKKDIVKASNGFMFISDAAEIAETVTISGTSSTFKIVDDGTNATFDSGTLLWAKNIQDDGSLQINGVKITVGTQKATGTTNGKDWIEYNITAVENGGALNAGDTIVRVSGGYLMNDATTQYSPFLDVYDGVSSWSEFQDTGKLKVRLGNLEGVTGDSEYGLLAGDYSGGSYIKATDAGIDVVGGNIDVTSLPRVSDEGLVSRWHFDEKSGLDSVGSYQITGVNIEDFSIGGVSNTAWEYNGHSAGSISYAYGDFVDISGWSEATIVASFAFRGGGGGTDGRRTILELDGFGLTLYIDTGGSQPYDLVAGASDATVFRNVSIVGKVLNSVNYTVVARYDFTNGTIHIDLSTGDSASFDKESAMVPVTTSNIQFGTYRDRDDRWFHGMIDEVHIWNRRLTDTETKYMLVNPSGNAGGLISTNQLVANEAWVQELTIGSGGSIVADSGAYVLDDDSILIDVPNLYIDSANEELRVGAEGSAVFEADGGANTVSMAGGILTADEDSVTVANFLASTDKLTASLAGGDTVTIGAYTSGQNGFEILSSTGASVRQRIFGTNQVNLLANLDANNEVSIGHDARGLIDFGLRVRSNGSDVINVSTTEARFFGAYADATDMWGGDADKADATVRLDFENGLIYYDAMGSIVYSLSTQAGDDGDASIGSNFTASTVNTENTTNERTQTKINFVYLKRRGINKMVLYFKASRTRTSTNLNFSNHTSEVRFKCNGQTEIANITTSGMPSDFQKLEIDVSSFDDDEAYLAEVELFARTQSTSVGVTASTTTNLNKNVCVVESTYEVS